MPTLTEARWALCAAACTYSYVQHLHDEVADEPINDTVDRIGRRLRTSIAELERAAREYTALVGLP